MAIFIGVGELGVSDRIGEVIKTMALGSCVAVIAQSPNRNAAGLLHFQLPESSINPSLAAGKPGIFADTGIPLLIKGMEKLGCTPRSLTIKLAGGAQIMDPNNLFNIGKRNYLAVKKLLWAMRLLPSAEDVGGTHSRSVSLTVGQAEIRLSSPAKGEWTL